MKKTRFIKREESEEMIDSLNLSPILDNYVRQVRWLYNNGNKCTMVYEEKFVRTLIHRLKKRIQELEREKDACFQGNDL